MKLTVNRKSMAQAISRTCQTAEPWKLPNYPNPPWKHDTPEDKITPEMRAEYQTKIDEWGKEVQKGRPIYSKLLLQASDSVKLVGMDRETCLSLDVLGCRVEASGKALFRPEKIGRVLDSMADDEVRIELDGEKICLTGERCQFEDDAGDPSSFLPAPILEPESTCVVDAKDLLRQIELVAHAAGPQSDLRFAALDGVQVCMGDPLTLFATNGSRMAWSEATARFTGKSLSPIVSKDSLRSVYALVGDLSEDEIPLVTITANASHVAFACGGSHLVTCQLQGSFPKWRMIVESTHKGSVMVKAGEFLSGIRQTGIMQPGKPQVINIDFTKDAIEFMTKSSIGRAVAKLGCLAEMPHAMRVNGKDIALALGKLPKDSSVTLRYKDKRDTLLIDFGRELQFVSAAFPERANKQAS